MPCFGAPLFQLILHRHRHQAGLQRLVGQDRIIRGLKTVIGCIFASFQFRFYFGTKLCMAHITYISLNAFRPADRNAAISSGSVR